MEYVDLLFIDTVGATVKHDPEYPACPHHHFWASAFKKEQKQQSIIDVMLSSYRDGSFEFRTFEFSKVRSHQTAISNAYGKKSKQPKRASEDRSDLIFMRIAGDHLRINKINFVEPESCLSFQFGDFHSDHLKNLDEFIELALPAMNNTTVVLQGFTPFEVDSFPVYDYSSSPPRMNMFRANDLNTKNMEFIKSRLQIGGSTALDMRYSKYAEFWYLKHTSEVRLVHVSTWNEQFLKSVLEYRTLNHITLHGEGWSSSVQDAIEDYALTKPFKLINCPHLVFYIFAFELLFHVPLESGTKTIKCQLYATVQQLSRIQTSRQITKEEHKVEWLREDGVRVSVVCPLVRNSLKKSLW